MSDELDSNHFIDYSCSKCGKRGVKLWRTSTYLDYVKLFCASCSCKREGIQDKVNEEGKIQCRSFSAYVVFTDQLGKLLPAVPTIEGDNFFGYNAVPEDRVEWWRNLPTHRKPRKSSER